MPKSKPVDEVLHDAADTPKVAMTATERKRNQRERDKARGHVEITVKVPLDRVAEIQQIAASMRKRKKRSDAGSVKKADDGQMDWVGNA